MKDEYLEYLKLRRHTVNMSLEMAMEEGNESAVAYFEGLIKGLDEVIDEYQKGNN